jgi:hypothetical protein
MAVCIGQDANTEVTGYGGKERGRSKEDRVQAMQDAKKITKLKEANEKVDVVDVDMEEADMEETDVEETDMEEVKKLKM